MRFRLSLGGLLIALFAVPLALAQQNWNPAVDKISFSQASTMLPHPFEKNQLLIGVSNQIYQGSQDQWRRESLLPESGLRISKLLFFQDSFFAITEKKIFEKSWGGDWNKIFEVRQPAARIMDFSVSSSGTFVAATTRGLFESKDQAKTWSPVSYFREERICRSQFAEDSWIVASIQGFYATQTHFGFQKVLDIYGDEDFSSQASEEETEEVPPCPVFNLLFHEQKGWAAANDGVYETFDQGMRWEKLPFSGLSEEIRYLAFSSETQELYGASFHSVYKFDGIRRRWQKLPVKTHGSPIVDLSLHDLKQQVLILTRQGLVTHPSFPEVLQPFSRIPSPDQAMAFEQILRREPSAVEVQNAVRRFANARHGKIKRWQAQSRLRALLPSLSFGKDFNYGNNIDIDRGATNLPDEFIEGPADISRGWDFDVRWDLGDLIFNSSQTSIDSREKLMVELAHDLSAEATRLYYERRRAQKELFLLPAENENLQMDQQLRVDELTALLDAMTGGWFSATLEKSMSPVTRHQSPVTRHQSPVTRHQSPEKSTEKVSYGKRL